MAEKLEVPHRYIQMVEGGQENLTVRSLATLADALGVQVVELFAEPKSRVVRPGRPAKSGA